MTEGRKTRSKAESGSDRLGELLACYSARAKGFLLLVLAAGVALLGVGVVLGAGGISVFLYDSDGLKGVYAAVGWVLVGAALLCAAFSPSYLVQSFEVRKKG